MKLLTLALLSFIVWNSPVYALPLLRKSFCEKVLSSATSKQDYNENESCFLLSQDYPEYLGTSLPFICMDTRIRLDSPRDAKTYCEGELAKLNKVEKNDAGGDVQNAMKSVYTGVAPTLSEHEPKDKNVSSKQLDQCQNKEFLSKYNECNAINSPVIMSLESISDILNHPSVGGGSVLVNAAPVYGENDCKCLNQKIKKDYAHLGKTRLAEEMKLERDRINGLIYNAVGKKFLNAYASNMEDVRYYLTNKFNALGTSEAEASDLQCNDAAGFQEAIESACATSKVPKEVYEKRTKELLSSFGDDMSKSPTLAGKFAKIDEFILNIKPDQEMMDVGPQKTFTRTEYDMIRNGASKKAPEVTFMNTVINGVLNDPVLKIEFENKLRDGQSPGQALGRILQEEKSNEIQNFWVRLIRENKNETIFKELNGTLRTNNTDDYPQFIRDTYKVAVGAHPGLKAILTDRALFNQLNVKRKNSYDKNPNLMSLLENDSKLLSNHFSTRCQKLRANLAQAVCTPDEDHIKRVKRDDINKLMTQIIGKSNLPLKDLLLCQMPEIESKGAFNKLSFGISDWLNRSDYLNRKLNPISKQDNGFSGTYRALSSSPNGRMREVITTLTGLSNEKRDSSSVIAKEISRGENFTTTKLGQILKPESSVARNVAEAISTPTEASVPHEQFSSAPTILPTTLAAAAPTVESKAMRDQLKDYLSDKDNDKTVDKLISNTKDEDVKELIRLKNELANDNEKIMNLMRENDRSKIKSLEESYQALEKQYQDALKKKSTPVEAVAELSDESSINRDYSGGTSTGSYTGGTDGSSAGPHYSDSSRSTSTGGQNAGRAIASVSGSRSSSMAGAPREANRGEIIVETNMIHSSDKQTEGQEINQEIISFMNKNETDLTTLQKLKEQGLTLKFKVLENGVEIEKELKVNYASMSLEAQQILDKKIAHQNIRSDQFKNLEHEYLKARRAYSYSALKMILGIQAQKTK
ncbi:hypothetical protein [Peredibacter starrii]|uniref:Uncharacterized protein n=1 Tax=Peredibacter starrii TaxID=28202 RepID=A0AAX4HUA2_9BACT|nr:hypothetical protein [Peredibacter starrii]WPU66949.1 hypothetical protein SOO65_09320 [Peredibacter starrii]